MSLTNHLPLASISTSPDRLNSRHYWKTLNTGCVHHSSCHLLIERSKFNWQPSLLMRRDGQCSCIHHLLAAREMAKSACPPPQSTAHPPNSTIKVWRLDFKTFKMANRTHINTENIQLMNTWVRGDLKMASYRGENRLGLCPPSASLNNQCS